MTLTNICNASKSGQRDTGRSGRILVLGSQGVRVCSTDTGWVVFSLFTIWVVYITAWTVQFLRRLGDTTVTHGWIRCTAPVGSAEAIVDWHASPISVFYPRISDDIYLMVGE